MSPEVHRILLVEDEANLGATVQERLQREGFECTWVQTAAEAKEFLRSSAFQVVILDVQLPDGNGFEIGAQIQKEKLLSSVIYLTARSDAEDRIYGLELGASDYLTKPFHLKELVLRIRNCIRHSTTLASSLLGTDRIQLGKASFDFKSFQVRSEGTTESFSTRECSVLKLLLLKRGSVVSRDEILNFVWTEAEDPSPRSIDNLIVRLRKWIEADPDSPKLIKSIRGIGYVLIDES